MAWPSVEWSVPVAIMVTVELLELVLLIQTASSSAKISLTVMETAPLP